MVASRRPSLPEMPPFQDVGMVRDGGNAVPLCLDELEEQCQR